MKLLIASSRRFLYRHPGQLVLALIGIAAGVAVVTGVALMRDVLIHSLDLAGEQLAGHDSIRIEHPAGRIDESILTELSVQRGAPALVPVVNARVRHADRILELLATDPLALGGGESLSITGDKINALMQTPNGIALNRSTQQRLDVAPGEVIPVRISGAEHRLEVVTVLPAGRAMDDRLIMDIAVAQDMLGKQGELTWIEAPATSRAWLENHLDDDFIVTRASTRNESAADLTEGMRANLSAMSLLSLAVGLFIIYSVLSFLLVQRRRSFGMLRAVGVTQTRLGVVLSIETLILSGFGALVGLVLGTLLADGLLGLVRQPVAELYGLLPPATVEPSGKLYAAIWLLTVILAQASTISLWREVRDIPPGRLVVTDPAPRSRRLVPGLALLLPALGLAVIVLSESLPAALAGLFLGLLGFALLAPGLGMVLLGLLRAPWPRRLPGRALAMLSAGRHRIAPALSALSLALALSAGIGMMVIGFRVAVDDWIDRLLRADVYLSLSQGNLEQELVDRVASLDEIEEVSSARRTRLPSGRRLIAYDLPPAAWAGFEWLDGGGKDARQRFVDGQAVVVSEPFARRHQKAVGDRLSLNVPGDRLEMAIAGIYRDYGSDQGTIAIHAPLYRERFDDPVRDSLGLYLTNPQTGDEALRSRLHGIDERIVLTSRDRVREQTLEVFDRTFRISWALALLVGIIAVVALVSALLALGLERRRDYATLRALGLTRGGLSALVISQTTGLAAAAALVAVPLALAIHSGLTLVVQPRAFGWSLPMTWPLAPLLVMLPLALTAGLVAGCYPAWRIARRAPAPELRQH